MTSPDVQSPLHPVSRVQSADESTPSPSILNSPIDIETIHTTGTLAPLPPSEKPSPLSIEEDSEPPDGGLDAWLTVLGAALVSFSTFGIVNAFGAFNDFYKQIWLSNYSATLVSMIGAIQVFILYIFAGLSGSIFDSIGPRYMIPGSGLITSVALLMLSFTKPQQIWQQYLTQAILFNLGATIGFFPSVAVIAHWFKKKVAWALGILVAGASVGGIVFPLLLHRLIPKIGFGWTIRIIALIVFCSFAIATLTIKSRRPTKPIPPLNKLLDFGAFRDPCYTALALGCWFSIFSLFNPYFYVGQYSAVSDEGSNLRSYFLTIMCTSSIIGRVLPGFFADVVGRYNVICITTLLSSVSILALWYTSSAGPSLAVFSALYGFASGPFFTLMPACVSQISPIEKVGSRIGMVFAFMSFGALTGTPLGGIFIYHQTADNFHRLVLFSGIMGLVGSMFLFISRLLRNRNIFAVV
ncbi:MFS general substrate transporter [Pluteus cervinus]|uniref:MFS general substrate transporter n=1 Tax=Pluteus cervinus TaxID=181527 RepID=A0ACD3AGJ8_9AGAR|nr:MFS general substrate transporter [Pluteus cervinus]